MHIICCPFFCFLHFIHSVSFSVFFHSLSLLLSVHPHSLLLPLPLPPCSTCLSKLGRAQYTHSTVGGPCLLSINNLWNSEIQVGPVSGRLYHTLEGGFPGTHDKISICSWHFLRLFPRVWLCFGSITMADHTSPDYFSCSLCLNLLRDPVAIPCGHSFCMDCISGYWNEADYTGIYICPQCKITFTQRPVLRPNATLSMVAEKIKKSGLNLNLSMSQGNVYAGSNDVPCDFCTGKKLKAVKSCLNCLASYCEKHLKPHYESATFKRHKLVDELGNLDRKICQQHQKSLELFCRTDQMCICAICTVSEHRGHDIVSAEAERGEKQVRNPLFFGFDFFNSLNNQRHRYNIVDLWDFISKISSCLRETKSWNSTPTSRENSDLKDFSQR